MTDDERRKRLYEKLQSARDYKHKMPETSVGENEMLSGWVSALEWVRDNLDLGEKK